MSSSDGRRDRDGRTTESLGYGGDEGGGIGRRRVEAVELGVDAAGDSMVKGSKGGIRVGVDREMFGESVGRGEEEGGVAGEGAEDGEGVFGIGGDVGVEKDEHVGQKVRQGVGGSAVPLGRGEVEDDGEMGGSVHNPNLQVRVTLDCLSTSPTRPLSESPSRAPVTKALPALAVTMG